MLIVGQRPALMREKKRDRKEIGKYTQRKEIVVDDGERREGSETMGDEAGFLCAPRPTSTLSASSRWWQERGEHGKARHGMPWLMGTDPRTWLLHPHILSAIHTCTCAVSSCPLSPDAPLTFSLPCGALIRMHLDSVDPSMASALLCSRSSAAHSPPWLVASLQYSSPLHLGHSSSFFGAYGYGP